MSLSQTPPETRNFDLVIVGGGLAGLCAAIAAARDGAKVGLIQDRPVFGGNCSSEIRVVPHGANHSNAWAGETGLPLALTLEDRVTNHEAFPDHGMINSHFDFTLLEAAHREPNLTFFLNTHVNAVESEPVSVTESAKPVATSNGLGRLGGEKRRILAVVATQMGSEKTLRLVAGQFVDATGDGTIGFLAGADYRYGREARAEFDEPLAPLFADDVTMGATITMRARDVGHPIKFEAPPWIERYEKASDIGFKRTLYHITQPVYGGYWWLEVCNPFHQIDDNAEIRHELHRHVLGVWNFIKNHSDFQDHASTYALDWIGMIPGKRESRRLMGDIVLTEHDCHTDRAWPDAIGFAGWWIDLHIKGGILNKVDPGERENADRNYKHWIRIPVFTLPLRAFYSRNIENMWMAGRCFSATHVALGPARVMQTLGQIGQAIGSAAAHALRENILPREMAAPDGPHIARLQQHLLRTDVRLPGLRNNDPNDLARSAEISASSEAVLATIEPRHGATYRLGTEPPPGSMASPGLAMIIPITEKKLENIAFHLRSESETMQRVEVIVQPLDRIWDRPADQPIVAKARLEISAGASGWFTAHFDAIIEPGRPYRIALIGGEDICWTESSEWPVGTVMQYLHVSPGGPEAQNAHLGAYAADEVTIPAYRHWRQLRTALAIKISPAQRCFGADTINNGAAWPDALPNVWRSDPTTALPQHIDLTFEKSVSVARVQVSFDTNLARANQSEAPFFRAPECVRDWRILAKTEKGWDEIYRETDNYQRHRVAIFDAVDTTALRIEVMSTNGNAEARIFEVRAYGA
jgi:FAD dependent oxidoreductase